MRKTTTALAALLLTTHAVSAQDIVLRLADSRPVGHYMTTGVADPLMAAVPVLTARSKRARPYSGLDAVPARSRTADTMPSITVS